MATATAQRIFEAHGVRFTGERGDQLIGYCPFTNREEKFYVNRTTWLWDSKTAGVSGNIARFLELTAQRYRSALTPVLLTKLSEGRGLPGAAFTPWDVGWTGSQFSIPVRDPKGTVTDIRMWRPGGKMLSTPGCTVGLLGVHRFDSDPSAPVYVCEGEWDAIALHYVMRAAGRRALVVAVPGAGTFKGEWVDWFAGRAVYALYDSDLAGANGEQMLKKRIQTTAQSIYYVKWPPNVPDGYDTRDWIRAQVKSWELLDPRRAGLILDQLSGLMSQAPRLVPIPPRPAAAAPAPSKSPMAPISPSRNGGKPSRWTRPPTIHDVTDTFKKWLYLDSVDPIKVMLATVVSQWIDGPPIWMFLVSPPGGAKTETLSSLNMYEGIYSTSSLTTHALISGANFKDGVDPSLIPRLDGKVMVIKDFTSILAMRDAEKDEIFGILRDAYDGRCGKVFGTGVERSYTSRFSILAAVTPRIYDLSSQHTSLGERFLKYAMGDNLHHYSEQDIIRRAIQNINRESEMREEIQDVVTQFLIRSVNRTTLPTIDPEIQTKIIYLSMFGARMRGSVSRDQYRNDIITSRPSAEVGSRLGIQLAKLAKALALVHQRKVVTMQDYQILKKVMLDTIPQRTEDILRHMLAACPTIDAEVTAVDVATSSRYPIATVSRLLQDLNVLEIASRRGTIHRFRWTLTPYIRTCIQEADLYTTREEITRPTRVWVRVRRQKIDTPAKTA